MKFANFLLAGCVAACANLATAHEGHGIPGTLGHDLQHQLWTFAALAAIGALLLAGDRVIVLLRASARRRRQRRDSDKAPD